MLSLLALTGSVVSLLHSTTAIPFAATNNATCSVTTIGSEDYQGNPSQYLNYTINIGRPYINGAGCSAVQATLNQDEDPPVEGWLCVDDGNGNTAITFLTTYSGDDNLDMVAKLGTAYPEVPFEKYRICMMDGETALEAWPTP